MIDIRILQTIPELEAVVDLEVKVWGLSPRHAVPSAVMHVLALRGGLVVGAYQADHMVGMLLALPVRHDTEWILWSHMTGIHPDHQGQGIGAALKRFQRQWALANGYRKIAWTFDPLQRGNARFNFHVLGQEAALIAQTYHVNFYGDMDDDINRGMPSDRVEAVWLLDQPGLHTPIPPEVETVLTIDETSHPVTPTAAPTWTAPAYKIAIPRDLDTLRNTAPEQVLAWRLALRVALQTAFGNGYSAMDFISSEDFTGYVVKPLAESW